MAGVSYTDHKLLGPLAAPLATYTGSLEDAIVAAQSLVKGIETRTNARAAVALLGMPGNIVAQALYADPAVLHAVDTGVGQGGIASIEFRSRPRSLYALVTAENALLAGAH